MTLNPLHIVVCGTDTDVGKTVVSALLVKGLNAIYWKPIQSGMDGGGDRGRVCRLLSLPQERCLPEIYNFNAAVSPHWAAEKENRHIEPNKLKIPLVKDTLVIETAGGVMVPLTRDYLQIEQLAIWKAPIILVARSGLGTLNHTLLTIEALSKRGITIMGIILNGPLHEDNPKTLEQLGGIAIIAQLPVMKKLSEENLAKEWALQNLTEKFINLKAKFKYNEGLQKN